MATAWAQFAVLQAWLLPGLAITSRQRGLSRVDRLLLAAPLSATVNALLVELLTVAHAYNRLVLVLVAIVEVGLIAWNGLKPRPDVARVADEPFTLRGPWDGLLLALCAYVGAQIAAEAAREARNIYFAWDAVLVWNPWAKEWYAGHFPAKSWHYPQLLPALMSLPYVAVQDDRLEQLSKWVTVAFPVLGFATGLRVAMLAGTRRTVVTAAVLVAVWRFAHIVGAEQAFGGMADVPVAYMVLASAYALLLAWRAADEHRRGVLLLAALIGAGALLTKLTAVLGAGMVVAWAEFRRRQGLPAKVVLRELGVSLAVLAVVAGHWYVYKEYQIRTGRDESEVAYVTSIVQLPWYGKLVRGWSMIWQAHQSAMLGAAVLCLASLRASAGRWFFFAGVVPAFVGWALLLSYDARNFAVGVLPLSATLAIGGEEVLRGLHRLSARSVPLMNRVRAPVAAAGLAVTLIGSVLLAWKFPRERLVASAVDQKRHLGDRAVNDMLYQILPTLPQGARVATSYQVLRFLPGLEARYALAHCDTPGGTADELRRGVATYYLLRRNDCDPTVVSVFAAALSRGMIRSLGEVHDHVLYQLQATAPLVAALDSAGGR